MRDLFALAQISGRIVPAGRRVPGGSNSAEYRIYRGMLQRCYNPKAHAYRYYGRRGIIVCDEWRHSFDAFLRDMGNRPGPEFTIERLDVDGNYDPDNCIWLPLDQQAQNTRKTRMAANLAASVMTPREEIRRTFKTFRGSIRKFAAHVGCGENYVSNVLAGKIRSGRILLAAELYAAELKERVGARTVFQQEQRNA